MLSILIPTYNYNTYPLVLELKKQADSLKLDYEILIQDDFSSLFIEENSKINELKNCFFSINKENLGRGNNINFLNSKAKFEYVLIMEADSFPEKKTYLQTIITSITPKTQVLFGGVTYPKKKPEKNKLLRWKYGNKCESISLTERLKKPYNFVFTWNLLLKKELLSTYHFPYNVKEYGYEDLVFIKQLKENKVSIKHIENRLIHFNSETSLVFLEKTEKAITTLNQLIKNNKLELKDTKLGKVYSLIQFWKFNIFICFLFKKLSKKMINNLTSSNPNLNILHLYKLGYLCSIK